MYKELKYLSAIKGSTEQETFENFKKTQMYCEENTYSCIWDSYWNHFVVYQLKF